MPKNYFSSMKGMLPPVEWSSSLDMCNDKMSDLPLGTSSDIMYRSTHQNARMRSRVNGGYNSNPHVLSPVQSTNMAGRFVTGPFRVPHPSTSGRPIVRSGTTTLFHDPSSQLNAVSPNVIRQGMREVPAWLKSLRLHKYTPMFQELTYDQMMSLDEPILESRGVTKGARRKIMQSIEKLKQRPELLRETEKGLQSMHNESRCVKCAIATLRQMLATPIPFYSRPNGESDEVAEGLVPCSSINEKNIPAMIYRVLFQVHSCVFNSGKTEDIEDEYLWMLLTVYDKILNNEVFTAHQKHLITQMKRFAKKNTPQDLRRQRVNTPHTGKCDSCQKESQRMDLSAYRRGSVGQQNQKAFTYPNEYFHKVLVTISTIDPKILTLPPRDIHTLCVMIEQQQRAQQHQQQMQQLLQQCVRQETARGFVDNWSNTCTQRNSERTVCDMNYQKPINPLFGPQPPYSSEFLKQQPASNLSSRRSQPPSTIYTASSPVSPSAQWPSAVYDSKDLLNLVSPTSTSNGSANSRDTMPMGQWKDVAKKVEADKNKKVKKDPSNGFPSHESTSGYSSAGSDRGSGAGSPRADRDWSSVWLSDELDNVPGLFHSTTWAFATNP